MKNGFVLSGGTTARDSLTTRRQAAVTDSVPSVMMITGIRSRTLSTPLTRPEQAAERRSPTSAASERVEPRDHRLARATTAEKLNIQPTDRSMSRMATTNTMPEREHADECRAGQLLEQGLGLQEVRAQDADEHDEHDERDDDAGLLGQADGGGRGGRVTAPDAGAGAPGSGDGAGRKDTRPLGAIASGRGLDDRCNDVLGWKRYPVVGRCQEGNGSVTVVWADPWRR